MDPRAEVAWIDAVVVAWCERTRLINPTGSEWIAETIATRISDLRKPALVKYVRETGGLIGKPDRDARGIGGRVTVGEMFAEVLTERGREDPKHAAECLVGEVLSHKSRREAGGLVISERVPAYVMIWGDDKDCVACKPWARCIVRWQNLPRFPLADCTSDHCRCTYMRWAEKLHGPLYFHHPEGIEMEVAPEATKEIQQQKEDKKVVGCLAWAILIIGLVIYGVTRL